MMPFITNSVFTDVEKAHLEFILSCDFPEKQEVIGQLNRMKAADITKDITPYYRILEFRPNGVNPGHGPMRCYVDMEVLHEDGTAPTEFALYERNGFVFELEIYNADSSGMDLTSIMTGVIYKRRPTAAIPAE